MSDCRVLTHLDYPDPDVIRVGDTYYMASTTMHFMPGCNILCSKDLVNWEHLCYVYDVLEETPAQKLEEGSAYGKGMWAPTLRYHKGKFYLCFVANDVHKTFLFIAEDIKGPWKKQYIEGFYHDPSLFFDEDDRVYIIYGNTKIHITELNETLTAPKEGGLDRIIVQEPMEHPNYLGYEGTHFYKINGIYYATFIHWPPKEHFQRRTESCFCSTSLTGEFTGRDVFDEDAGYDGQGVAQGGIVDTPDGKWYAILFQDRSSSGRIPVLLPVTFEDGFPVFGKGELPKEMSLPDKPLVTSRILDETGSKSQGTPVLHTYWQFNHIPDNSLWTGSLGETDQYTITTGKLCENVSQAQNTLTQRALWPGCYAEVTLDAEQLKVGDSAGLCAFQSDYGWIGITRKEEGFVLQMVKRGEHKPSFPREVVDTSCGETVAEIAAENASKIRLQVRFEFADAEGSHPVDRASFAYEKDGEWITFGETIPTRFSLDHFTGYRFAMFLFATKEIGGQATFSDFRYYDQDGKYLA